MCTLVSALDALSDSSAGNDMYVGECQDSTNFNQDLVQGNLLICSYSIRFVLGLSTIKQAMETAKNLSAAGVVFYMDPFVIGFQLNPIPLSMPGIIIPTPEDSKVSSWVYKCSLFVIQFFTGEMGSKACFNCFWCEAIQLCAYVHKIWLI